MKKLLLSILQESKTRWLQSRHSNPIFVDLEKPIMSLTFDDVPLSAYECGLPILEKYQAKATFYVSLGIESETGNTSEKFVGPSEVKHLLALGHEIGCHTFSHYRLSKGTNEGLARDAMHNSALLRELLGKEYIKNFSFPFGELSPQAKKYLSPNYRSLRSSRPGINKGKVDLNCLRAVSMGNQFSARNGVEIWLNNLQAKGGWAIFYTHGISEAPGLYDITPKDLDHLLAACNKRGIEVATVDSVLELMQ